LHAAFGARKPDGPAMPKSDHEWLTGFLEYLQIERAYSKHTINAYRSDVQQFRKQLGSDLLKASSNDVAKFIVGGLESGTLPTSMRRKLAAIRGFYGFMLNEEAVTSDPTRYLRGPKAHRPLIRQVTRDEVGKMLGAISMDRTLDLRDRALIFAAYGSGLRVSELVSLRMADLDFQHSVAKVRLGKGQKDRYVPLNEREIESIKLYLEKGRQKLAGNPDNDLVFIGRSGKRLIRQRVWQIFTRLGERVLHRRVSPHKFRHAFVSDTINGGAQARSVQHMVGHARVSTTMGYMHFDFARVRDQYLKSHPRELEG
jgi:integrase/recombinase XerD